MFNLKSYQLFSSVIFVYFEPNESEVLEKKLARELVRVGFANKSITLGQSHCMKGVRVRSFSSPYFPTFELNTKRYGVSPYSAQMPENTDQKNSK